ncbi:MAG TPA: helix-turn-helix transcriptional regulator [Candidatus Limnocylindria bacterium]|nr:helix-turn-helix transcriptional regulator [Candidatus Limnocylindria bacterium]
MSDASIEARNTELRTFLRARRRRLAPTDVGLPAVPRRRAHGLRRDDVAELAGVSVSWYAQFELGRTAGVSPRTVSAVARALRLDEHETAYLFALTRTPVPPAETIPAQTVAPEVRAVVDRYEGGGAVVFGRRYDILVANRIAVWLGFVGEDEGLERNIVWRVFTHAPLRERFLDWELLARRAVAYFRDGYGRHVGDPAYEELIATLHRTSSDFTRVWERHRVKPLIVTNTLRIRVPGGEPMQMATVAASVIGAPGQILSFMSPSNPADLPRLHALVARDAQPR